MVYILWILTLVFASLTISGCPAEEIEKLLLYYRLSARIPFHAYL